LIDPDALAAAVDDLLAANRISPPGGRSAKSDREPPVRDA
jgi:hypothetical protein